MSDELPDERRRLGTSDRSGATESPLEAVELSRDRLFDVLADRCRRRALSHLAETSADAVSLTDLVAGVVARESGPDASTDRYETVAIALRHVHLPTLAEAGLLDYDARTRTVRYYGHARLEEYLALADEYESRPGGGESRPGERRRSD